MESSPDTEANGKGTHSNSDHSNFAAAAAAGTPNGSSSPSPPATSPPPLDERAEALKEAGNKLFSEGRYPAAIASYTAALEIAPSAALFCNRAFAHLKCENYGSAMADADAALALDGSFVKAYYRRASAKLALAKYKAARVDFKQVVRLRPADKDARSKLDECERAVRKQAFEDAIALEATKPLWDRLAGEVAAMTVDVKYAGPHLPSVRPPGAVGPLPTPAELAADETLVNAHGISLGFVKALMAEYKAQRGLPRKYSLELLLRLNGVLRALPSLVSVPFPPGAAQFNVCGDTHGQYYDTLNIFALAGLPGPSNPYLFNGDFVDRGSFSLENVRAGGRVRACEIPCAVSVGALDDRALSASFLLGVQLLPLRCNGSCDVVIAVLCHVCDSSCARVFGPVLSHAQSTSLRTLILLCVVDLDHFITFLLHVRHTHDHTHQVKTLFT